MMIVRLIAHTPEPEKVVAAAAKLCYSDAHITDLLDGLDEEKTAKFLTMLSDLGHAISVLCHYDGAMGWTCIYSFLRWRCDGCSA